MIYSAFILGDKGKSLCLRSLLVFMLKNQTDTSLKECFKNQLERHSEVLSGENLPFNVSHYWAKFLQGGFCSQIHSHNALLVKNLISLSLKWEGGVVGGFYVVNPSLW